jgi:hypothetical protein
MIKKHQGFLGKHCNQFIETFFLVVSLKINLGRKTIIALVLNLAESSQINLKSFIFLTRKYIFMLRIGPILENRPSILFVRRKVIGILFDL